MFAEARRCGCRMAAKWSEKMKRLTRFSSGRDVSALDGALVQSAIKKLRGRKIRETWGLEGLEDRKMLAAAPSVTNASTLEDTQSTSGLVITANDGVTTDYLIDNITNGTLVLHGTATAVTNGSTITLVEGAGGLDFTPSADLNSDSSSFSFTIKALETGGINPSSSKTATISVTAVNDAPSFTSGNDSFFEDGGLHQVPGWATGISAGPADEAGQKLTFNITSNSNPGLFASGPSVDKSGELSYTNKANANGTAVITLTLSDNGGTLNGGSNTSAEQTFTISISGVNDPPTFIASDPPTINEDAGLVTVTSWATFNPGGGSDESGQTGTYTVGAPSVPGLFAVAPAVDSSGTLTYTLSANQNGSSTFTVFVTDNGTTNGAADWKSSATQTFTISVNAVNDQPTFSTTTDSKAFPSINDTPKQDILEDSGSHVIPGFITAHDPKGVATTATDENSQTFTYFAINITSPPHFTGTPFATFTVDPTTGDLTYTTKNNWYGTWVFQVGARDSGGTAFGGVDIGLDQTAGGPTTFTLTIDPVADEPQLPVTVTDEYTMSGDINIFPAAQDFDFWPSASPPTPPEPGATFPIVPGTVFYQITNITNGVLYYNSAVPIVDEIHNGDYITAGAAALGLKFKPYAGLWSEKGDLFGFDIQETLNGADLPSGFAASGPGATPTHHNITVHHLPDFVSDTVLEFLPQTVTPGQRVFATVSWQNTTNTQSFPQTLKVYRSSDGSLGTLDELLVSTIIPGVRPHRGIVVPVSWIASVADADADGDNDGTAASYLVAVIDEEGRTGDGTDVNDWDNILTPDYVVTVPDVSIDPAASDLEANEGQDQSGRFVLRRSGDTSLPLTVYVEWNNPIGQVPPDLASPADFKGGTYPGLISPATTTAVTFLAGRSTAYIDVSPIIDTNTTPSEQNTEHLVATIVADPNLPVSESYTIATLPSTVAEATLDIQDVINTINLTATDTTASEAKTTTAAFRLSRGNKESNKLPITVTVDFGTPLVPVLGTNYATPGTDFIATINKALVTFYNGTLADITIPANKNFVDIKLTPIDDFAIEGTEVVTPTVLDDQTGNQAYIPGANPSASASITDNDDIRISAVIAGVPAQYSTPTNSGNKVVRFTVTVFNSSNTASQPTTLQVGLIPNGANGGALDAATFNGFLLPLQTINMGSIAAGGKRTKTFAVRLSSVNELNPGVYRIAAKADAAQVITELNEDDNYAFTGAIITVN